MVCRSKITTPSDLTYKLMVHVSAVRFSVFTFVRMEESLKWSRVRLRVFLDAVFCCVIGASFRFLAMIIFVMYVCFIVRGVAALEIGVCSVKKVVILKSKEMHDCLDKWLRLKK